MPSTSRARFEFLLITLTALAALGSTPARAAGPITSAQTAAGTIGSIGASESWTFSGTVGNRVLIAAVETGGTINTNIALHPPGGGGAVVSTSNNRVDYQLAATGTYTIVVDDVGDDGTGSYTLGLLNLTAGPLTTASDLDGGPITSGEVRTAQIHALSEWDAYTFTGASGDRVIATAVATGGSPIGTNLYLYPPAGAPAATSTGADRLEFQLNATGTWTIVIEDNALDQTGAYSMSFMNVTAGPWITVGDADGGVSIASATTAGGQMHATCDIDAFRFNGIAGQRVLVGVLETAGTWNSNIALYAPNGGAAEVNTSNNRIDHQLLATGTYTIVIEDVGNDTTGPYSVGFLNLTGGPLTTGGDPDGGPITSGEVRAAQIHAVTEWDAFSFAGTIGDRVVMTGVATGSPIGTNIYLYPPAGAAAATSTGADRLEFQLTSTGTWTIVIEDNALDQTGAYAMSFMNVSAGPWSTAGDPDGGVVVPSATTAAGQMHAIGDIDAFRINGSTGDRVLLGVLETGGSWNSNISLYPPGGGPAEVSTSNNRVDHQLLATGAYTIVIEDIGNDTTGPYSLGWLNLTSGPLTQAGDLDGGPITSGEVRAAQIHSLTEWDAYTISATAGDRVIATAVATGSSPIGTNIYFYPPAGGPAATSTGADRLELQLSATGTWTLLVEDNALDQAGAYTMSLLNVTAGPWTTAGDPDGGVVIPSATTAGGQMHGEGDLDAFRFTGSAGDRVLIGAVETGGTWNSNVVLYPPGGSPAEVNTSNNRVDHQLLLTGTYTIVIEDVGNDSPGLYSLGCLNLTSGPLTTAADPDGGPTTSAQVRTAQIHATTEWDAYTFTGASGQRVVAAAVATGSPIGTNIYLYPPAGAAAVTSTGADRLEFQLTGAGTWTFVVEDNALDETGAYSFSFVNITAGPWTTAGDADGGALLTSAQTAAGQLHQVADFDVFRINGTAGDRILFGAVETGGAINSNVAVYPPNGGTAEVNTSNNRVDHQLQQSGTYSVVIEDVGNDATGPYSVGYLDLTSGPLTAAGDPDGGQVLSAQVSSAQIHALVEWDAYTFHGTTGDRVLLVAVATSGAIGTNLYLYPPAGAPPATSTGADRLEHQLTATGTWTFVVEDNALDQTGSYNTSFLNITAGPLTISGDADGGPIVPGGPFSGSIASVADVDGFRFYGVAGDNAQFTAVATSGALNTQLTLYPPGGGSPLVSTSNDNFSHVLAVSGDYRLVIEDVGDDDPGSYNLSIAGTGGTTAVEPGIGGLQPDTAVTLLRPAYPSPFAVSTVLSFALAAPAPVSLRVYNVAGELVRTVVDQTLGRGEHRFGWDGRDNAGASVGSGVYYVDLRTGERVLRGRVVRVR